MPRTDPAIRPAAADDPSRHVAAIVVTHESAATIDECLGRLRQALGVHQVRVVDNASRDATLAIVQRHAAADPRVRFVANPDNPGFSVACNQGAAASDAPWLAFVNPDCLVEADSLQRLGVLANGCGDATPQLLGADLVDASGVRDPAARRRDPDFAAMLRTGAARDLAVAPDDAQPVQPVDAISGALMFLPRVLFETIGGFDPGYRLHAEDLDLCRRARAAGAQVAVANAVRIVHLRGVSSAARPLFVEWHRHRGLWRYFRKFEAPARGTATRWLVGAAVCMRLAVALLRAALRR